VDSHRARAWSSAAWALKRCTRFRMHQVMPYSSAGKRYSRCLVASAGPPFPTLLHNQLLPRGRNYRVWGSSALIKIASQCMTLMCDAWSYPPPFFDNVSDSIPVPTRWFSLIRVEGLISKFSSGSAAQGPTASFSSLLGGRARLPRCKKRSKKFIVRLMPTNLLSSLQTLSCRLVYNFANLLMYLMMGVNLVQIRVTLM